MRKSGTAVRAQVDISVFDSTDAGSLGGDFSGATPWKIFQSAGAGTWSGDVYGFLVYNNYILDADLQKIKDKFL